MGCQNFASRARHVVQIQQPGETQDAIGGTVAGWSTLATAYAIIEPVSGREQLAQQRLEATHTHKVTIRYNAALMPPDVGCKMRLVFGTRIFNIRAVRNVEELNQYLELSCEEGVPT